MLDLDIVLENGSGNDTTVNVQDCRGMMMIDKAGFKNQLRDSFDKSEISFLSPPLLLVI